MTEYPQDEDGQVLAELAAQGVDMSKPLLIEFPVAVPDEPAALKICSTLCGEGYDAEIQFDSGEEDFDEESDEADEFGPSWTVFVAVKMVPDYAEILRIQQDLDRIVKPLDGFSDGWGVMLDEQFDEDFDDDFEEDGEEEEDED